MKSWVGRFTKAAGAIAVTGFIVYEIMEMAA